MFVFTGCDDKFSSGILERQCNLTCILARQHPEDVLGCSSCKCNWVLLQQWRRRLHCCQHGSKIERPKSMDRRGGEERPILIALKGHPGTGKSTLATAIAKDLKCPLIDKDLIRDSTYPIEQALIQFQAPPTTAQNLLNDLSYEAMWRVVSTQLSLGLSVVVVSPLSRRAHLDQLLDIAMVCGARVAVVECKPGDELEWRRRLELRGGDGGGVGWHKPSTWGEMERLLEGYGGCWDYDVGEVPKLVLDTTAPVEIDELVSEVVRFVNS